MGTHVCEMNEGTKIVIQNIQLHQRECSFETQMMLSGKQWQKLCMKRKPRLFAFHNWQKSFLLVYSSIRVHQSVKFCNEIEAKVP